MGKECTMAGFIFDNKTGLGVVVGKALYYINFLNWNSYALNVV